MKYRSGIITAMLLTLAILFTASTGFARIYPSFKTEQPKPHIIKGLVTIQLEDDVNLIKLKSSQTSSRFQIASLDAVLEKYEVNQSKSIFPMVKERPAISSGMVDLTRYYELQYPEDLDINEIIAELEQDPNIRMAEPVWAMIDNATPNDPLWEDQWAMSPNTYEPGFYDAWDKETGSDSIIVGIIDGGVLYNHPDLTDNIWVNPGEDMDNDGTVFDSDDLNGVDDDGNGIIDDLVGYDFYSGAGHGTWPGEDGDTPDPDPSDFTGHGTHVAGIVAAVTNNGIDVTGVAGGWYDGLRLQKGARIMCLRASGKAADGNGWFNSNNTASCINYAVNMEAHVINASFGGGSSSVVNAAFSNAVTAGLTVTHSAGNDDQSATYEEYDLYPGILTVASTNGSDQKSSFSDYGSWVNISAPGSSILSTVSYEYTPGTASWSGTSMAAPMVAGLACLIRSAMPSLTSDQVDSIIMATAESENFYLINYVYGGQLGAGRIDAAAALADLAIAKFTSDVVQGKAPLQVQFTDLSPNSPVAWDWTFGTGDLSTDQNPLYTYNTPGIYDISLIIDENNPLGLGEEYFGEYIWVTDDTARFPSVDDHKNSDIIVPVYLANTAPVKEIQLAFKFPNSIAVKFDSISTAGLRTDYFETNQALVIDNFNKNIALILRSTNSGNKSLYLAPDTGVVVNLYFTSREFEGTFDIDTATVQQYTSTVRTLYGEYWPSSYSGGTIVVEGDQPPEIDQVADQSIDENVLLTFDITAGSAFPLTLSAPSLPIGASFVDNGDKTGSFSWTPTFLQGGEYDISFIADDGITTDELIVHVSVIDAPCCVDTRGNINGDQADELDISDLVFFIDYTFNQGDEPPCPDEADVNADQSVDIADIVYMIEYMLGSPTGPPPLSCP